MSFKSNKRQLIIPLKTCHYSITKVSYLHKTIAIFKTLIFVIPFEINFMHLREFNIHIQSLGTSIKITGYNFNLLAQQKNLLNFYHFL